VYEEYMDNYMSAFKLCKVIVVTYAPPGTPGHHHVNLQEQPYWLDKFKTHGFTYSSSMTDQLRDASTMNLNKKSHEKRFVQKRGMVFVNDLI
jgi:predicted 3-demethylubiquinone-9 3-methyltransferase (glyoxalase superfamily)